MPVDYTPNPSHNPSLIPLPSDGDPPDVSSINPSLEALADKIAHAQVGGGSPSDMQALTSPLPGERFIIAGLGVFFYNPDNTFTPENKWVYDATGAGVGQWIHELFSFANVGLAGVGPLPGEPSPAAANRIKRSLIEHGYFAHNINSGAFYDTALTGLATLVQQDIPDLLAGDIVECHINAVARCTVRHNVGTYASENGGAYVLKTPVSLGSSDPAASVGEVTEHALALSFFATVTTGGTYSIQIKGETAGSSATLRVTIGSWLIKVTRP